MLSAFDVDVFCPSPAEGQPRAVILGMLAARPCVSTGAEGVVGLIEDSYGAIVSPENDAPALAAVLRGYEGDPERVRREGALAAKRAVERFDRDGGRRPRPSACSQGGKARCLRREHGRCAYWSSTRACSATAP